MICFCYFCQKNVFSTLDVAHNDPFSVQIGSKKQFLRAFTNFFQNHWIATKVININCIPKHIPLEISQKKAKWVWSLWQNLGQIRSNILKKKKQVCQCFFPYFARGIHLQAKR